MIQRLLTASVALGISAFPLVGFSSENSSPPLAFIPHAQAYAQINNRPVAIDPHVFVEDPNAPDGTGPEGIHHIVGFRAARMADDPSLPVYDNNGGALDLSLGRWLAAAATARESHDSDGNSIHCHFSHMIPFGFYSLFLNKTSADGNQLFPLHSEEGQQLFAADGDGNARLTVPLDHELHPNESIELVYHSDDLDHNDQPGDLGSNAHVQLVLLIGQDEKPESPVATPPADQSDDMPL